MAARWGAQLGRGGHVLDTRRPLRQFPEQVVVSDVGKVGTVFIWLFAELDLGPKTKVAAHLMIYKTH